MSDIATRMTAEEFLDLDGDGFELLDGILVEKPVGALSAGVGANLVVALGGFVKEHRLGRVFGPDTAFNLWPDRPTHFRRPDVSYLSRAGSKDIDFSRGSITVRPDLVVEVISPNDRHVDFMQRMEDYNAAGVPLTWVIYPETKTAHVLRAGSVVSVIHADGYLDGEDIVPGFRLSLAELLDVTS